MKLVLFFTFEKDIIVENVEEASSSGSVKPEVVETTEEEQEDE